ncbi:MAG: hypothetical protein LBF37_04125 [Rickettsiales bacterium]|nr:hypothetical protein [Rickettsiales bacterium]
MRKIFINIFRLSVSLLLSTRHADADIASVAYVHDSIYELKNISLPIPQDVNSTAISGSTYLYRQIDNANLIMNGVASNYESDAANTTISAERATTDIMNLISCFAPGRYPDGKNCAPCPKDFYCTGYGAGPISCDTVAQWYVTNTTGATSPGDCRPSLPQTINPDNCTYNIPSTNLSLSIACLGTGDTNGHWELVSSYTGSAGDDKFKKVGSVPPGLYRVETFNPSFETGGQLGTSIILTSKTMYYGHADWFSQTTSRLFLSIKSPFVVGTTCVRYGATCNWNYNGYLGNGISCYDGLANTTISLDDNDGTVDRVLGYMTPGITKYNTETPLQASAIYRWVNN